MTDDAAQSAPPPGEPAPPSTGSEQAAPEPAAPVVATEPLPLPTEPAPVVEQTAPTEPTSVIPEASQSAPESAAELPDEVSAPEPQPATQAPPSPQQAYAAPSSQSVPSAKWSPADRAQAIAKRVGRKEARLAKVVALAKEKGRITNDDIEKLLHVSDATASRYGTILVQRGLLKREGKGRGVEYVLA